MSDNIDDVFNDECDAINYSLISCQIKLIKKTYDVGSFDSAP